MEWDPTRFFHASGCQSPYALLVLNQPINESAFGVLSEHASYIICADGGANRLYDMTKAHGTESTNLPDAIVGDLDSIHPAVRQHYLNLGVGILEDPDQYSTDFTKCLKHLNKHAAEIIASPRRARISSTNEGAANATNSPSESASTTSTTALEVLVLGGLGGRVDQAFSQIHHLYTMAQTQQNFREDLTKSDESHTQASEYIKATVGNLYLISEESITFILCEGKNIIHTPATNRPNIDETLSEEPKPHETSLKRKRDQQEAPERFFEENVGIIPLLGPASITTQGLEWDVQDWHTKIGGQLSTSNHIRADKVEVKTSMPVLFTVELAQKLKRGEDHSVRQG